MELATEEEEAALALLPLSRAVTAPLVAGVAVAVLALCDDGRELDVLGRAVTEPEDSVFFFAADAVVEGAAATGASAAGLEGVEVDSEAPAATVISATGLALPDGALLLAALLAALAFAPGTTPGPERLRPSFGTGSALPLERRVAGGAETGEARGEGTDAAESDDASFAAVEAAEAGPLTPCSTIFG